MLTSPFDADNLVFYISSNIIYRIRSNYRTYPYKPHSRNSVVFRLQPVYFFLYFFIKAYVVGTHLNCIDLSMQCIDLSMQWEIAAVFLLSPLTGKVQGRSNTNQVLLIGILCFYHRSSVEFNKFLTLHFSKSTWKINQYYIFHCTETVSFKYFGSCIGIWPC